MNAKVTGSKAKRRKDLIKIQSNVNDLYSNLILLFSFVAENNAEIIRLNPLENKERRHQLHPLWSPKRWSPSSPDSYSTRQPPLPNGLSSISLLFCCGVRGLELSSGFDTLHKFARSQTHMISYGPIILGGPSRLKMSWHFFDKRMTKTGVKHDCIVILNLPITGHLNAENPLEVDVSDWQAGSVTVVTTRSANPSKIQLLDISRPMTM